MDFFTADICDEYPDKTKVLGPGYQNFGGINKCQGVVTTIKLDKNNADLVALLRDEDPAKSSDEALREKIRAKVIERFNQQS